MKRVTAIAVLPALALSCGGLGGEPDAELPSMEGVSEPVDQACKSGHMDSWADLVAVFGEPVTQNVERLQNPHSDDQIDEHHLVTFRGAQARFIILGTPDRTFLLQLLRIDAANESLPPHVWIGKPITDLQQAWGPPYRSRDSSLLYGCNESDDLSIDVDHGIIRSITWYPYVD